MVRAPSELKTECLSGAERCPLSYRNVEMVIINWLLKEVEITIVVHSQLVPTIVLTLENVNVEKPLKKYK